MRKVLPVVLPIALALLLASCGSGSSSGSGGTSTSAAPGTTEADGAGGGAKTPEQVWAKEVEGVMRQFENTSAHSVEAIHTSTSKYTLEPTYATYSDELAELGRQLEATKPPPICKPVRDRMGVLAHKVSNLMGVLGNEHELTPEEFSALAYQQTFQFGRVGRKLTQLTVDPHC